MITDSLAANGIEPQDLQRYLDEQVYTVPGTTRHRDEFTVLLTGSRALGVHEPESDVDIDVVCPRPVYESVLSASFEAGIIRTDRAFFCTLADENWGRYFGPDKGRPHFSVTPLDWVGRDFREYHDVHLWVWLNARIIADPGNQFEQTRSGFEGYPKDVLVRKIKYYWLRSDYASVDTYPHHPRDDRDLLAAASGISNAVNDLLRVFFLVEGKPFPYAKNLMRFSGTTALGREFGPLLQRIVNLAVGREGAGREAWDRLEEAVELLICADRRPEALRLDEACAEAAIAAGVEPEWVEAGFDNIDQLLFGELGPVP